MWGIGMLAPPLAADAPDCQEGAVHRWTEPPLKSVVGPSVGGLICGDCQDLITVLHFFTQKTASQMISNSMFMIQKN